MAADGRDERRRARARRRFTSVALLGGTVVVLLVALALRVHGLTADLVGGAVIASGAANVAIGLVGMSRARPGRPTRAPGEFP